MRQRTVRTKVATEKAAQREARAELQTSRMEELYMCPLSTFQHTGLILRCAWSVDRREALLQAAAADYARDGTPAQAAYVRELRAPLAPSGAGNPPQTACVRLHRHAQPCGPHFASATARHARMRRPSPCASWRVRAKCCRCRAHCGPPTGRSTRIRFAGTDADQRKGLVAR